MKRSEILIINSWLPVFIYIHDNSYKWLIFIKACVGVMCFLAAREWGRADSGGHGAPWGAYTTTADSNGRDKPQFEQHNRCGHPPRGPAPRSGSYSGGGYGYE